MDAHTIWAYGLTALIIGGSLAIVLGIVWWIAARRGAKADKLLQTTGMLDHMSVEYVKGAKGSSYWMIETRYSYSVDGKPFTGKRPTLAFNSYPTDEKARAAVGERRAGQEVTVWYDPAKPGWSSLDNVAPPLTMYKLLTLLFAAVAVAGGIVAAIYA